MTSWLLLILLLVSIGFLIWFVVVVRPVVQRADSRERRRIASEATQTDLTWIRASLVLKARDVSRSVKVRREWIETCQAYLAAQRRLGQFVGLDLERELMSAIDHMERYARSSWAATSNLEGLTLALTMLHDLRRQS